jgi:hypothetical protein
MELKVIVPTSLSEITVEQYQRFARLEGDNEFLTKKALEIFCNVPFEQLPSIRFKDVSSVFTHINAMMKQKPKLTPKFTLKGQEFGFITSLEDISYGEFVDLDSYISDTKNLHKTMAVLYRPITRKNGRRYEIEPYESATKYCDLMKEAPMEVAMGAVLFFWTLGKELLIATLTSLEKPKRKRTPTKPNSESDGDGILRSIPYLKAMLGDLMKLEDYPFINASPSSPLKNNETKQKAESSKANSNEAVL